MTTRHYFCKWLISQILPEQFLRIYYFDHRNEIGRDFETFRGFVEQRDFPTIKAMIEV